MGGSEGQAINKNFTVSPHSMILNVCHPLTTSSSSLTGTDHFVWDDDGMNIIELGPILTK